MRGMTMTESAISGRRNARVTIDRTRQASGDEARRRAMHAAMTAISELGADRIRMSDIAERAGMSTGHILYHFGHKDRLLYEVLTWSEADLRERFRTDLALLDSPQAKLARFVDVYLPDDRTDERWALWTQVLSRPLSTDDDSAGLVSLTAAWEEILTLIVAEGQEAAVFVDLDAVDFAIRSRALLDGLALDVTTGSPRWKDRSINAFALAALERELLV